MNINFSPSFNGAFIIKKRNDSDSEIYLDAFITACQEEKGNLPEVFMINTYIPGDEVSKLLVTWNEEAVKLSELLDSVVSGISQKIPEPMAKLVDKMNESNPSVKFKASKQELDEDKFFGIVKDFIHSLRKQGQEVPEYDHIDLMG